MNLEGKTTVVTGASRGLGAEIAGLFAAEGARVISHARTREDAQRVAAAVGGEAVWGDLAGQQGVTAVAQQVLALAPVVHVLVLNAGIGSPGGLADHTREQFDRVIAVNAAAPLFLTQALLGPLRAAGRAGRVVLVSSDSGRFSVPKNGMAFPYRMSKAALNMLTLNLAAALADDGTLVNAIHPGWMRTDMGSPEAPVAPEEAARHVLELVALADGGPSGLLWEGGQPVGW